MAYTRNITKNNISMKGRDSEQLYISNQEFEVPGLFTYLF